MKTSAYTNFILTVIAVCLSVIVLKEVEIIPQAKADPNNLAVAAPSFTNSTMDVRIVGSIPIKVETSSSGIDVKVTNTPNVKISNTPIEVKTGSYSPLEVKTGNNAIEIKTSKNNPIYTEITNSSFYSIPVKVTNVKDFPTSLEMNTEDNIKAYATNGGIRIQTKEMTPVEVYTIGGFPIYKADIEGETIIPLSTGMYIVKAGNNTSKVMITKK